MALRTLATFGSFLRRRALGVGLWERLLVYAVVWAILTEGDLRSFAFGMPAMVAAALLNPFAPRGPRTWRLARVVPFFANFAWLSLRSAVLVGYRVIHPDRPLAPALVDYAWRLQSASARQLMANLLNLMPGTLTVDAGGAAMAIHILGAREQTLLGVRQLEERVAVLFGEVLVSDA